MSFCLQFNKVIVPYQGNLEQELENLNLREVNTRSKGGFHDCLSPNETHPEKSIPHLKRGKKGLLVSCGTERSFFNLILDVDSLFEGLLIRDINPRVKAYVDFNKLLIGAAQNRTEYELLSKKRPSNKMLIELLKRADLSPNARDYYQRNIFKFAKVYYSKTKEWRSSPDYAACHYHLNDAQFEKLQRYVREGKIVATIGPINDLTFLRNRQISVVDISNIWGYSFIDLRGPANFNPIVMLTRFKHDQDGRLIASHASYQHTPLSPFQRLKWLLLVRRIHAHVRETNPFESVVKTFKQINISQDKFNYLHPAIWTVESYNLLRIEHATNFKK